MLRYTIYAIKDIFSQKIPENSEFMVIIVFQFALKILLESKIFN